MKKLFYLALLTSIAASAQYKINGSLEPVKDFKWVLLYKVEGAKQTFIKNASLKKESKTVNGKNITVGKFDFDVPENDNKSVYRITFDLQNGGFTDVLFNKENIDVIIYPNLPQVGLKVISSEENKIYQEYSNQISNLQYKVDSTQVSFLKNPTEITEKNYQEFLKKLKNTQALFETKAKGKFAFDFIKASKRYNSSFALKTYDSYISTAVQHFFDYIDFNNPNLLNSSFIVDRIADFVFYMNFASEESQKQEYYKKAIDISLQKIYDVSFKADVIEFLITQFSTIKNTEIITYLFTNHFQKLPVEKQNKTFKEKIYKEMATAIGNIAPDFSWTEAGKKMKLSEISGGENYLLIFYSTGCSHCLREVPQVFDFLKNKTKTKVIAFAMEETDEVWKNYKKTLQGWHHVLGLKKWENEVALTYQINSTPTYFVLGMDKKIIANPDKLEDLKKILEQLN